MQHAVDTAAIPKTERLQSRLLKHIQNAFLRVRIPISMASTRLRV